MIQIPNKLFFANIQKVIDSGNSVELKVKGTSMHPTLSDNKHKVVLIPYRSQHLRIGDIALFIYKGKHILHRLISIRGNQLTFQGDNLPYVKEYVGKEDIIAIAEFIIAPSGKVTDCKKRSFYIKSRLRCPIYRYRSIFGGLINVLFLKVSVLSLKIKENLGLSRLLKDK